jgi:Uma2 family endonuclease
MKAHKLPEFSVEEYLKHEAESDSKYEYQNGQIFALAGGTINHGLLCANIYSEIRNELRQSNSNCKPLSSEIKLHVKSDKYNSFLYPDTMVICGELEESDTNQHAVKNPVLIVEVLSKSTADYDRGDKFHIYRQIPNLQEYVLIEQDKYVVDIHYKNPKSDLWRITRIEGKDSIINLQSLNIFISMENLYFDVKIDL